MTRAPSGGRAIPQSQLAAPTAGGDRTGDSATYPPMGNGPRSGRREPTRRRRAYADARRQTHDDQRDAGHAGPVPNPAAAYSRTSGGDRPSNGRAGHWQSALRVVQLSRRERRDHLGAEPCDHDLARWGRGQLECSRPAGPQVRSGAPALVGTEARALLPGPMRIRKLHDRLARSRSFGTASLSQRPDARSTMARSRRSGALFRAGYQARVASSRTTLRPSAPLSLSRCGRSR